MKDNFEQCLAYVLKSEGGFSNHPSDPGGMTNLGITKAVWEDWTGQQADEAMMRSLTIKDVTPLYRKRYWDRVQGDILPSGIDYAVFDFAVNSGPSRAIKALQSALGVTVDGIIGFQTINAARTADALSICQKINDNRLSFLQSLSTWDVFGKGWAKRVESVQSASKKMIG